MLVMGMMDPYLALLHLAKNYAGIWLSPCAWHGNIALRTILGVWRLTQATEIADEPYHF